MNNKKEQITNLESHRKNKEASSFGELLPQILTNFVTDLKPKLVICFEALDDTLFDLAEKSDSNQKQTLYFESMRSVRKSRDKIFIGFFKQIKTTFKSFKNNEFEFFETEKDDLNQSSLSLIDDKELDETLAITNLIQKSEMVYHRHIFALKKRFSLLASGTKLSSDQIPVSPHVVVNSFANSIKILDMDVTTKLILYKLFERCVMGQLNDYYNHTNDFLAEKGILPEIKYNVGRKAQGNNHSANNIQQPTSENLNQSLGEPVQNQQNSASVAQNNHGSSLQQNVDPNYQVISQLFKRSHQQTENNSSFSQSNSNNLPVPTPVANIDMGSMINALSILQGEVFSDIENKHYSNKSPTEIKDDLINQLHKLDSNSKNKKVRQKDEDTINLVALLFQFIVEDRNLPDSIQVILARLQIPYLKIALKDSQLFSDKTHPARTLLDKLSLASVGWSDKTDKNSRYISKLENVVHDILELDEYGHDVFTALQADFEKFLKQLKKKSDVLQKRTQEKTIGQEKISQAKEQTAQLLVNKMTNKQMPILIRDILLGEWSNVLILMHLRHTTGSEEYKQKVLFIDEIIKYCVPVINDKEITKKDVKKLSDLYKTGLDLLAFQAKELIDKQHELINCIYEVHEIDLSNKEDKAPVELIPAEEILQLSDKHKQHEIAEFIEEIITPSEDTRVYEAINDEFSDMVDALKVNTWMEFVQSETTIRAKLSWISPITGKFLFVNSRGLKTSDKSKLALAEGLRNKSIRLLEKVALFDRALDSIAKNLEKGTTQPE